MKTEKKLDFNASKRSISRNRYVMKGKNGIADEF
jgi:hypothetical protein